MRHNDLMAELADAPQLTVDAPAGPEPAPAVPLGPALAPVSTPRPKREWKRTVAKQASMVSDKLAPLARTAGDRVAAASPMTLLMGLLGLLTALSIIASLAFENALGVTSAVLFAPALSAALGALVMRTIAERRTSRELHEAAREEDARHRQLEHTLDYVDTKLTTALTQFGTEQHNDAVIAMFQAKAATEIYRESTEPKQNSPSKAAAAPHYQLGDFLSPNALRSNERAGGLSLI